MNFVSASQAFESELSVRVAALLQQRVTLTVENTRLKQQMARLRQQKLFMEGQHLRISFHWHAFRESPSMHIYIYNWRLSRASFCFDAWLSRYVTIAWSCTCTSLVDLDLSNFMPLFSPNRYICVWVCEYVFWVSYSTGQYQSLRKEAERLKAGLAGSPVDAWKPTLKASSCCKDWYPRSYYFADFRLGETWLESMLPDEAHNQLIPEGLSPIFAVLILLCGRASKEVNGMRMSRQSFSPALVRIYWLQREDSILKFSYERSVWIFTTCTRGGTCFSLWSNVGPWSHLPWVLQVP